MLHGVYSCGGDIWRGGQALQKEAAYFRDHPSYKGLDKRVGTANLSKTLNQVGYLFSYLFLTGGFCGYSRG